MKAHQQRVIEERNDLDAKIEKLRNFIYAPDDSMFKSLDVDEQHRLVVQLAFMISYLNILTERIANFK